MHGLGDTGHGFVDTFNSKKTFGNTLKDFRICLPTAQEKPVTMNDGWKCNSWYDIG